MEMIGMAKSAMKIALILIISIFLLNSYGIQLSNVFVKEAPKITDEFQEQTLQTLFEQENSPVASETIRINTEKALTGLIGGFLENKGQKSEDIHHYTESREMTVGFGTSEIRYSLAKRVAGNQVYDANSREELTNSEIAFISLDLKFLGSNEVVPVAEESTGAYNNLFIGSDRNQWSSSSYYSKISYYEIYEQIDLVYEINNGQLKYEFFVYPGGNLDDIQMQWKGPVSLELVNSNIKVTIQSEGLRNVFSSGISLVDTCPINYQSLLRENPIEGSFKLLNSVTYGFETPDYDPEKLLIIDPVIFAYQTQVGGSSGERGHSIAVDNDGNAYVTGYTQSTDFPVVNAYNATGDGNTSYADTFVFKLSANGSNLVYSTYVGGRRHDYGNAIAVDASGLVYVAGESSSADFPVVNPINATSDGNEFTTDVIIFKLSADGTNLLYSTYITGGYYDRGKGIAIDGKGDVYVTGESFSDDFPTVNAYNATGAGNSYSDAFVLKMPADGSSLLYSTYVAGSSSDFVSDMAIDKDGAAYVTGETWSADFPAVNSYQTYQAAGDVYAFKLAANGSKLLYSTIVGGSGEDGGHGITVDEEDSAYVTGDTESTDFPVVNAYNATGDGNAAYSDAFVFKLSTNGSKILYSTYLSGSWNDFAEGILVDSNGRAYVTGHTVSNDFPNQNPSTSRGGGDVFLVVMSSSGSSLEFSTIINGNGSDNCEAVAKDSFGNIYITGFNYIEWPNYDVFVFKLPFSEPDPPQGLSFEISANHQVLLSWSKPDFDGNFPITFYRVYRKTSSSSYSSHLAEIISDSFFDLTTESGNTYYYKVTAMNIVGESIFSNEISVMLPVSILTVPDAPSNHPATANGLFVYLNWSKPNNDGGSPITGYHVYRGTSSGEYALIYLTSNTYYNDTLVESGVKYYYVVTAVNSIGESAFSNEINATPIIPGTSTIPTRTSTETSTPTPTSTLASSSTSTEVTGFTLLAILLLSSIFIVFKKFQIKYRR
jgi:hypothetical protein